MKFNIRKISAIGASVLMAGLTMGTAMAANYPAPFVSGGSANAAIVYGTGSGVSNLDQIAANAIQADLGESLPATGSTSFEGGEVFTLDKDSNHFNLGDGLNDVHTSLNDDDMEVFLADGTYDDGDIDETYEQKITLSTTESLSWFADGDYNDDTPTFGFEIDNGDNVLTYEIEFDDAITTSDMNETDMPLMGREYYVLNAYSGKITLLDTAEKHMLAKDDTITVNGHVVSIEFIDADEVIFEVDGELVDKIDVDQANPYEELDDGSYIVLTEVLYDEKESGISKAEFALGSGKIELITGEEAELNDEDIDGLDVTLTGGESLTKIELAWTSDDESFLTEANALVFPTFETIKLGFGGMDFPDSPEIIEVGDGTDVLSIEMDNYDLELMYFDTEEDETHLGGGTDYNLSVAIEVNSTTLWLTNNASTTVNGTLADAVGMELVVGDRFLITNLADDIADIKTAYYEVTSIDFTGDITDLEVELGDMIGADNLVFDDVDDLEEVEGGDISIQLWGVADGYAYFNFTATDAVSYNTAVSEKGLLITLPTTVTIGNTSSIAHVNFTEADKDDDVGDGDMWAAAVKLTSNDKLHVSSDNVTKEEVSSDNDVGYVLSDLASMVELDSGGDEYDYTITYYGEEVTADVWVASADAQIVSEGVAQIMVVKDTEVSSVSGKNLIVVGGSCINSAAAALVGGAHCGAAWTTATGVGSGQFLIKSYASSSLTSEMALLVAGYEKEDTTNAATYLRNKVNLDTSATYKGTSATSAELIVS